jgi:hypothetical protein
VGGNGSAGTNGAGNAPGTVKGGFGGMGGMGGPAAANNANGNNGGNGAKGGKATVNASGAGVTTQALGGMAGAGGPGSDGGPAGNSTRGGNGGNAGVTDMPGPTDNGDATASAKSLTGNAYAEAIGDANPQLLPAGSGGPGGNGSRRGGNGGNGAAGGNGEATATAVAADANATTLAAGGHGGEGGAGGNGNLGTFTRNDVRIGGAGGNGAPGGNAMATSTAQGSGGKADATAAGGAGGFGGAGGNANGGRPGLNYDGIGGAGGNGANGGNATAIATAEDGPEASAIATAGNGGNVGVGGAGRLRNGARGGSAGDGGTAVATASALNLGGDADATARATAGNGGAKNPNSNNPPRARPGNATATATATAPYGTATATPTATNGLGEFGSAIARGVISGLNGDADSGSLYRASRNAQITSITAEAKAPIPQGGRGQAQSEAAAGDATAFFSFKPNTTLNSFAGAVGDPLSSDVVATSVGKPNVIRGLEIGRGGHQLGLVELGGLYPTSSSGGSAVFFSSVSFEFNPTALGSPYFAVGLEDGQLSGGGFDLLNFEVLENGVPAVQSVFTTAESALAYFNDQVLDLGALRPGSNGLIDLTFDLSLTGHIAGDGFAIDLAVADVPEPRSAVLLATGLALVFGLARRRALLGSLHIAAPKPIRASQPRSQT